jgi:hypothetical protein
MLRACLGVLVLLGLGEGLAFAQSAVAPVPPPQRLSLPPAGPALLPTVLQPAPGSSGAGPGAAGPGAADPGGGAGKQPAPGAGQSTAPGQTSQGQTSQTGSGTQDKKPDPDADLRDDHYGPHWRGWTKGGLLLWWVESAPAPGPLVTTGGLGGGALGASDTRVLFGNNTFNYGLAPGIWLESGVWLDCKHQWGVGLAGFVLETQTQGASFTSDAGGSPLLTRPIIPAIAGQQPLFVSVPGASTGSVGISANMRFWGGEANAYRNLVYTPCWEVTALAGFRYLDLMENLGVASTSTDLGVGSTTTVSDRFTTRNQLYLGQVGAQATWTKGPLFVNFQGKVGLGPNGERVRILGSSTQTFPGFPTAVAQGGLLAVPGTPALAGGNVGVHSSNFFVIVPEVGLDVGWQISDRVRVSAGYSLLYINSVARPGSQVNLTVNTALVPTSSTFGSPSGPGQPTVLNKQDEFWAHGLRFMLELRF